MFFVFNYSARARIKTHFLGNNHSALSIIVTHPTHYTRNRHTGDTHTHTPASHVITPRSSTVTVTHATGEQYSCNIVCILKGIEISNTQRNTAIYRFRHFFVLASATASAHHTDTQQVLKLCICILYFAISILYIVGLKSIETVWQAMNQRGSLARARRKGTGEDVIKVSLAGYPGVTRRVPNI